MTVVKERAGDDEDLFPAGMRVLAVDDNPLCLKLLETLLRSCHYKVTTTNQAITALRMLRERKDDFDLVISDVDMPDMDGFKLLEHVGLEMDLPVIMLSAHGDPQMVMRGITHGACDYLLKPVRREEIQNIWQHVIRRRSDVKDPKGIDKAHHGNEDGGSESKLNKKRKDVKEDDEEDCDNDRGENEDPMTQKKPRVVWSVELHGKFVTAVNQLGLDKAVPKKILDLMNVDKLTRENVASHLQKYRLYLKRIKSVASHQALADASFVHSSGINGFGPQHLASSGSFPSGAFRNLPNRGFMRRLNASVSLGVGARDLPTPPLSHLEVPGYLANDQRYFQNNILHGLPISVEREASLPEKVGISGLVDGAMAFPSSDGLLRDKTLCSSRANISFLSSSSKPGTIDVLPQAESRMSKHGQYATLNELGFAPNFTDRCENEWRGAVPSSVIQHSNFPLTDSYERVAVPSEVPDDLITMDLQRINVPQSVPSVSSLIAQMRNSSADLPCQFDPTVAASAPTLQPHQAVLNYKADSVVNTNDPYNPACPTFSFTQEKAPMVHSLAANQLLLQQRTASSGLLGIPGMSDAAAMNYNEVRPPAEAMVRPKEFAQQCLQGNYATNCFGSLEDLIGTAVKQERGWGS